MPYFNLPSLCSSQIHQAYVLFFFNRIHGKNYQRNRSFSPIKKSEDAGNEAFMAERFRRYFPIKPADRPFEIISP